MQSYRQELVTRGPSCNAMPKKCVVAAATRAINSRVGRVGKRKLKQDDAWTVELRNACSAQPGT